MVMVMVKKRMYSTFVPTRTYRTRVRAHADDMVLVQYSSKEGIKNNFGQEKVFALGVGGIVRTMRGGECTYWKQQQQQHPSTTTSYLASAAQKAREKAQSASVFNFMTFSLVVSCDFAMKHSKFQIQVSGGDIY